MGPNSTEFQPRSNADPISLARALDKLNVHDSPPPSLAARFAQMQEGKSSTDSSDPKGDVGRSPPIKLRDPEGTLRSFIAHLLSSDHDDSDPNLLAIGYELEALLSIYPASVKLSLQSRPASMDFSGMLDGTGSSGTSTPTRIPNPPPPPEVSSTTENGAGLSRSRSNRFSTSSLESVEWFAPGERIRYEVTLPLWEAGDTLDGLPSSVVPSKSPDLRVLVSLPPTYPTSSPPQLQLLGRYLGSFTIDAGLFGDVTRTYISSSGVPFSPGDVCVYEGLTYAQQLSRGWYIKSLSTGAEGEKLREADRRRGKEGRAMSDLPDESFPISPTSATSPWTDGLSADDTPTAPRRPSPRSTWSYTREPTHLHSAETPMAVTEAENGQLPDFPRFTIFVSQPIVDRKSTFIGHAIKVTDEREVPLVIHEILSDKKVAKAAHPAMFAYRIAKEVGGAAGKVYATGMELMADCDDDGETAAGSRLAHLLEILEVENVLVVVSRWYGGTLLGADRFKHINQAARDALDVGGFLDVQGGNKKSAGRRK